MVDHAYSHRLRGGSSQRPVAQAHTTPVADPKLFKTGPDGEAIAASRTQCH
jgi:hypothetical protein